MCSIYKRYIYPYRCISFLVNFKKDGNKETITVEVPRFDKGNKSHTATATVTGRLVYLDLAPRLLNFFHAQLS